MGRKSLNRKYVYLAGSLILIIAVFASFTLYEILQKPFALDIFATESATLNMIRPDLEDGLHLTLNENISNSYISDAAVVSLELVIKYSETGRLEEHDHLDLVIPYGNLWIALNASAVISDGFIHSMMIKFFSEMRNSSLSINEDFSEESDWIVLRNIEIHEIVDFEPESYIDAQAVGKPLSCMLNDYFIWRFYDPNILDHQLSVILEVTYFNGTAYRKAVVPTKLAAISSP